MRSSGLGLAAMFVIGCAAGSPLGGECDVGSDCESGACREGVCVENESPGGAGAGGDASGGESSEGGQGPLGGMGEGGGGLCELGNDGEITRAEVPLEAGLSAKFRVATSGTISSAPTDVDGTPTWDFSETLSGDQTILIETLPVTGAWYAGSFPGASYAARLSQSADLLGVFEITDTALLLRGVVSPEDGITKTELEYDPPVTVLSFPMTEGDSWSTDTTVTGTANGVFGVYFETYENTVDTRGNVVTPFSTFDSLRVRVDLTRTTGAIVTTQRTFAFVTECFGTIATMVSQYNELETEFDDPSEIRRLTP